MNPYICVTYAQSDRQETDLFCRGLSRYGFRFSCINELSDPARRCEMVEGASLLIALPVFEISKLLIIGKVIQLSQ